MRTTIVIETRVRASTLCTLLRYAKANKSPEVLRSKAALLSDAAERFASFLLVTGKVEAPETEEQAVIELAKFNPNLVTRRTEGPKISPEEIELFEKALSVEEPEAKLRAMLEGQ